MKLAGQVAIITGWGRRNGRRAGAPLRRRRGGGLHRRSLPGEGQAVADEITAAGGRALAVRLDVQSADEWAAAVATTEEAFGPVTILCNNAGANVRVSFDEQTEEMWHHRRRRS